MAFSHYMKSYMKYRLSSLFLWFNDEIIFVSDEVLENSWYESKKNRILEKKIE